MYNQKSIVNGKWKFFCTALALLYAGDVIAGDSFSSKNLRRSNSKTRVTSFNTGASLSRSSSRSSVNRVASYRAKERNENSQDQQDMTTFTENKLQNSTEKDFKYIYAMENGLFVCKLEVAGKSYLSKEGYKSKKDAKKDVIEVFKEENKFRYIYAMENGLFVCKLEVAGKSYLSKEGYKSKKDAKKDVIEVFKEESGIDLNEE
jgi:uncharacterized protein YegP (UPF0339 family)